MRTRSPAGHPAWRHRPLPSAGRVLLLALVGVAAIASGGIATTPQARPSDVAFDLSALAALALFSWHPPSAALALLLGSVGAPLIGHSAAYGLTLAFATGLVVYCCSRALTVVYCGFALIWVLLCELFSSTMHSGASLLIISVGLVSAVIGRSFRLSQAHNSSLKRDVRRLAQHNGRTLRAERERIADELHNVIAHDLTVVVMHSRALDLVAADARQQQYTRAIVGSASQALTDLRRMLRFVTDDGARDDDEAEPEAGAGAKQILDVLARLGTELTGFGARVELLVPGTLRVSSRVNDALVHVAQEGTTNIMKHAPHSRHVRIQLACTGRELRFRMWNEAAEERDSTRTAGDSGYGLARLAERVRMLGGTMLSGGIEGGWIVSVRLPRE